MVPSTILLGVLVLSIALPVVQSFDSCTGCTCFDRDGQDVIDCSGRNYTTVPEGVRNQGNVYEIILSKNKLTHMRLTDFTGTTAELIDLSENDITTIDERAFENTKNLKGLDLHGNELTELPLALSRLPMINSLDVRNNPDSGYIPIALTNSIMKEMGDTIQTFKFGHRDLDEWPETISHFQDLQDLTLDRSSDQLKVIPPLAFHSFRSTLLVLTITNTELVSVPLGVSTLRRIDEFHFDNNKRVGNEGVVAQAFVRPGNTGTLKTLSLINDNLTSFPRALAYIPSLLNLDMSNNRLEFISDQSIENLRISHLTMHNCNLDRIPGALFHLTSLNQLDMSHNNLVTIENNDIENIPHVTNLTLAHNPIKFISDTAFGSHETLNEVDISYTNLNTIPEAFNTTHVNTISLEGSSIDCMCSYVWVSTIVNNFAGCCDNIRESIDDYITYYVPLCPEYIEIFGLQPTAELSLRNHLPHADPGSYGMEISANKTKLMTNNDHGIQTDITANGEKIETLKKFQYLGAIVSDEGSKPEVLARVEMTAATLGKLNIIWKDKAIKISSKIRIMRSLVHSVFLYACETWTLTAALEKRIQASEMRCFRRLLGISYKDHITNEEVKNRIRTLMKVLLIFAHCKALLIFAHCKVLLIFAHCKALLIFCQLQGSPDLCPLQGLADICPLQGSPDLCPLQGFPDFCPLQGLADICPLQGSPDLCPLQGSPDLLPTALLIFAHCKVLLIFAHCKALLIFAHCKALLIFAHCKVLLIFVHCKALLIFAHCKALLIFAHCKALLIFAHCKVLLIFAHCKALLIFCQLQGSPDLCPLQGLADIYPLQGSHDLCPLQGSPDICPLHGSPDLCPLQGSPDLCPLQGSPDLCPLQGSPDLCPLQGSPDLLPTARALLKVLLIFAHCKALLIFAHCKDLPIFAHCKALLIFAHCKAFLIFAHCKVLLIFAHCKALLIFAHCKALLIFCQLQGSPDLCPLQGLADICPLQGSPDLCPLQGSPDLCPLQGSPDLCPTARALSIVLLIFAHCKALLIFAHCKDLLIFANCKVLLIFAHCKALLIFAHCRALLIFAHCKALLIFAHWKDLLIFAHCKDLLIFANCKVLLIFAHCKALLIFAHCRALLIFAHCKVLLIFAHCKALLIFAHCKALLIFAHCNALLIFAHCKALLIFAHCRALLKALLIFAHCKALLIFAHCNALLIFAHCRSPDLCPLQCSADLCPLQGSAEGSPDLCPLQGSPDICPLQGSPDLCPLQGSPDICPLQALLSFAHCKALLIFAHCKALLIFAHCKALLIFAHCKALLIFAHCKALLIFAHCNALLIFAHCRALLKVLLIFAHCKALLIFAHCKDLLIFAHCKALLIFTHCKALLSFAHCKALLIFAHCKALLIFAHCRALLKALLIFAHCNALLIFAHCRALLKVLLIFAHCKALLIFTHCKALLSFAHCKALLIFAHCKALLIFAHCKALLIFAHCKALLIFAHCKALLIFAHCNALLIFAHCRALLKVLLIFAHCKALLIFAHCKDLLIFAHCKALLIFTHCKALLSFAHCKALLIFANCKVLLIFAHCKALLIFAHCRALLIFAHCKALLIFAHCKVLLIFAHCKVLLIFAHCKALLIFAHCKALLIFAHCNALLIFAHCRALLKVLLIFAHCKALLIFAHCKDLLIFAHCKALLIFTHCKALLSFAHCKALLIFAHCKALLIFAHCKALLIFAHCRALLKALLIFAHCKALLIFAHCKDLLIFANCKVAMLTLCLLLILCLGSALGTPCCSDICDCEDNVVTCESKSLVDVPICAPHEVLHYTEMRLAKNGITNPTFARVPDSIKILDLSNNRITVISIDKRRPEMESLDLSGNGLTVVPTLSLLPALHNLNVVSNPIPSSSTGFPVSIFRQLGTNLTSLHVGHPTTFKSFPDTISSHLPKLETFEINGADYGFSNLGPNAFSAFELVLKHLYIRNTHLSSVPLTLRRLRNLEELYFEGNPVSDYGLLSEAFSGLNSLTLLSLKNDSLTSFPAIVNNLKDRLQTLILDDNKLLYIRENALNMVNESNIETLSLRGCHLDRVPGAMADDSGTYLQNIRVLDLSNNKIQSIDRNDLHDLRNLQNVSFSENPLAYVSTLAFRNLPSLAFIDFSNTSLKVIPMAVTNVGRRGLDINLKNTDVECICELACFQKYYKDHSFHVHGDCETVSVELTEYLETTIPACPNYHTTGYPNYFAMKVLLYLLVVTCFSTSVEGAVDICPPNDDSMYPSAKCSCVKGDLLCQNLTIWPQLPSPLELNVLTITNSRGLVIHNNTFQDLTVNRLTISHSRLRNSDFEENAFGGLTVNDLDLNNNHLATIPIAVRHLTYLKGLDVSGNGIPGFDDPEQIETMSQIGDSLLRFSFGSRDDIASWPTSLKHFPRLEELNCTGGDFSLMSIDSFYGYENSLKKLSIKDTLLYSVPLAFGRLKYLTELSLNQNHLIGDFGMNVPITDKFLTHLSKISLDDDNITTFPDILGKFRNLKEISMDGNNLKFVSEVSAKAIQKITHLSLRNSGITRIPGTLQYINSLESIDLSNNGIHTIERKDLQELVNLKELKMNDNPIVYLSDNAFTKSANIDLVELRNTSLTKIPCGVKVLKLSNHDLTLDFRDNVIECTCALRWLYNWRTGGTSELNHKLNILGECVTIQSSLQEYMENTLPDCPEFDSCFTS
ncbi:uncharacterized protein LOC132545850 [Ylistrum balloti]|uniref:uncharacterized protein LOC132545850 n=1 Tax=Ylistrum balloti TaxID=509963 RepID=UPI002905C8DB|nr:uncharacterized protein LOC132545850 [Ylistrum balloti]